MKSKNARPILISLIIALSVLIVVLIFLPKGQTSVSVSSPSPSSSSSPTTVPSPISNPTTAPSPRPSEHEGPKLAIVIDDVGYAQSELGNFLDLDIRLTFAILPGLKDSKKALQEIKKAGQAIILHQPLEPMGDENPGPGLISSSMSQTQIEEVFGYNLSELDIIDGFNNHMGSKGTQDISVMTTLLSMAKKRGLFFLDSRTTDKSVAKELATKLRVPFLERDVFLDDVKTLEAISGELDRALVIAKKQGRAIAIGHIYSDVLVQVLKKKKAEIEGEGISLVWLKDLLVEGGR